MTNTYFQELNYTMANEDTELEFAMIERLRSENIFAVGGSGSRCLPFLALPIKSLDIVDVSPYQLKLIELKLKSIRELDHRDAIALWHADDSEKRRKILSRMQGMDQLLSEDGIPPLYQGKWERTFRTFAKIIGLIYPEKIRRGIFEAEDSYAYYKSYIAGWKWDLILKILGNKSTFNSLLYKGHFIRKNSPLSYYQYYAQAFDRLFKLDVRKSHFLQICFFGKVIHEEALPIEFRKDIFEKIKISPIVPVYHQGSAFEVKTGPLDFVSLSDVPSYLSGEIEQEFNQKFLDRLKAGGVIVNRHYLRIPERMNLSGFSDISSEFHDLTARERVQMYQLQVLKKD